MLSCVLLFITVDLNDLQNFVNIALATAAGGEDDLTRDKLSNLRTIGSGFGPLIYELPKTAGYHVLQEHCQSLWDTLKHAPQLPKIMVSCKHTHTHTYIVFYLCLSNSLLMRVYNWVNFCVGNQFYHMDGDSTTNQ